MASKTFQVKFNMVEFLIQPFQYEFFIRGITVAIVVGGVCGLLGVYVIMRGMSYIGHGMSHAVFGGAAVSHIININLYLGAAIWGFVSAFLINEISKNKKVKADAAIGLVTTAGFAVGILIISTSRRFTQNFEALLFGNILGITDTDLLLVLLAAALSAGFIFLFHKRLLFTIFDRESAKVYGIKIEQVEIFFSLILATVVIASMSAIGVTLLAAAIIAPAISARMLTNNFQKMLYTSAIIGSLSAFAGMYSSFLINSASGPTIVLFGTTSFGLAALYSLIKRKYHIHRHGDLVHMHPHSHRKEHMHDH